MCSGGSAPAQQPRLPQAPVAPDMASSMANDGTMKKKRGTAGGTILTSPQGATTGAATTTKTLLGA